MQASFRSDGGHMLAAGCRLCNGPGLSEALLEILADASDDAP